MKHAVLLPRFTPTFFLLGLLCQSLPLHTVERGQQNDQTQTAASLEPVLEQGVAAYQRAYEHNSQQDFEIALNYLQAYYNQTTSDQKRGHAASLLADIYSRYDNLVNTQRFAQQAIHLPSLPTDKARAHLALAQIAQTGPEKERQLQQALAYESTPIIKCIVYTELGMLHQNKQNYQQAVDNYTRALEYAVPERYKTTAHINLGIIYTTEALGNRQYDKAVEHFNAITQHQIHAKFVVLAHLWLGSIYIHGGHGIEQNPSQAQEHLNAVLNNPHANNIEKQQAQYLLATLQLPTPAPAA